MTLPFAISSTDATFWLAVIVLLAAVVLAIVAARSEGDSSKQLFAIVGVLIGLVGAGGLGSLFANKVADEAAEKAAPQAAEQVSEELTENIESGAIKQPDAGANP